MPWHASVDKRRPLSRAVICKDVPSLDLSLNLGGTMMEHVWGASAKKHEGKHERMRAEWELTKTREGARTSWIVEACVIMMTHDYDQSQSSMCFGTLLKQLNYGFRIVFGFLFGFLSWYHLPCICNNLESVILHGICYMLAWLLCILHGICYILACLHCILHGICYIWPCSPSILHGIYHVLALQPLICMVFATIWYFKRSCGFLESFFRLPFRVSFKVSFRVSFRVSLRFHLGFRVSCRVSLGFLLGFHLGFLLGFHVRFL